MNRESEYYNDKSLRNLIVEITGEEEEERAETKGSSGLLKWLKAPARRLSRKLSKRGSKRAERSDHSRRASERAERSSQRSERTDHSRKSSKRRARKVVGVE